MLNGVVLFFFSLGVISFQAMDPTNRQIPGKQHYHLLWMICELQFKKEILLQFRNI